MSRTCPTTGKRCYPGPHSAKRACSKITHKLRVYRCANCGAYHVTKQPRPSQGPRP